MNESLWPDGESEDSTTDGGPDSLWEDESDGSTDSALDSLWEDESESSTEEPPDSLWDGEGFSDQTEEEESRWELGFTLRNKFALDTEDNNEFESDLYNHVRAIARIEYRHSDRFFAKMALQGDYFFYRYEQGWENDDDLRIHDAYINFSGSGYNLRFGNQIVRWGKADGFSPLDNVNPEDFRDGIAGRREDRKIPVPMANLQVYRGPFILQGIYIPFFEKSEFEIVGTDWALFGRMDKEIGPFSWDDPKYSKSTGDSQGGGRIAVTFHGFDLALSYLNRIDDLPSIDSLAMPQGFIFESDSIRDLPRLAQATAQTIRMRYDRTSVWGLELETTLGDFVVRGDLAYTTDSNFLTENIERIEKPVLDYVVGFDYNSAENLYLNFQFAQTIVQDWEDSVAYSKEITNAVSGTVSKEFFDGNLKPEFRFYYDIEGDASIFNPKILLEYWQNCTVEVGAEFFHGEDWTVIGTFKDNDQVYAVLEIEL